MQIPSTESAAAPTPRPRAGLEGGWSIHVTFPANAAVLTLLNPQGEKEHISFALGFSGGPPLTITDLDQIEDGALRTAAHQVLDEHATRVAAARRAIAEFNRLVPPAVLEQVTGALAAQQIMLGLELDADAVALGLALNAAGPAAGTLLALVARWRRDPCAPAEGLAEELVDGIVTARLSQGAAIRFLTWLSRDLHEVQGA
ncbi:hypothetical protein KDK95_29350 [Actinospica sp. MGRD01-02]|uniref:Uncharacterized protein n=1 Tax=Actinospica acidithermotolerans TaxID=2828514 RepID=A0A941IMX5_9ACTN|nr:hypothetical protein [Actinospica acidithermotolerans]MBR7830443.1 hypothetical protein [Actinospica acidithermotolerans]